jgi:hypothetical protein
MNRNQLLKLMQDKMKSLRREDYLTLAQLMKQPLGPVTAEIHTGSNQSEPELSNEQAQMLVVSLRI